MKQKIKITEYQFSWLLFLIPVLLYFSSQGFGFVLDDFAVISENKFVHKGIKGWSDILTTHHFQGYEDQNQGLYRPLSLLTFSLIWEFFPNNALIPHILNVWFYGAICVLLFKTLRQLFPQSSINVCFWSTLIFAIHPVHTEVVANIKSLDELLCFFFILLSIKSISADKKQGWTSHLKLSIYFLLALLSKESAILCIPIFILIIHYLNNEPIKKVLVTLGPTIIVALAWLALKYYVIQFSAIPPHEFVFRENSILGCPDLASQKATAIYISGLYLFKCFFPIGLAYDYSFNQIPCQQFADLKVLVSILSYILLVFSLIYFWKKSRITSFGIAFFLITIALASNLIIPISTTMGDRLLFTPVLGMTLALVGILDHYHFKYKTIALGLITSLFLINSFTRIKDWKSMDTLASADIYKSPRSAKVVHNYAILFLQNPVRNGLTPAESMDSAIFYLKKCTEIDPGFSGHYIDLAKAQFKAGHFSDARESFRNVLRLNPTNYPAYDRIAELFLEEGNLDSTIYYSKKVISLKAANESTYNRLGVSYFRLAKKDSARLTFKEGLILFPNSNELQMNLAAVESEK